ncbi:MAG TPA: hypothetical protein VFE15_06290 [Marmoricola sp.]|jgi:hypothetical protein|nr:hypothetical protein [Marmoricola sp.]
MSAHLSRRSSRLSSGLAFVLAGLVGCTLITQADVGWLDVLGYLAYVGLFVTVPGVLAWRFLWTGARGTLLEHVVFGTLLGMILQLPLYLVGVALGEPRLTVLLPVAALVGSLAHHDRRSLFRPTLDPVRPLLAWTIAVGFSYAMLWETKIGWHLAPQWGKAPADPIGDQQFQLALVTELRHHVPPKMPFVAGEPLRYHWFSNEFVAAATWWTRAPDWALLDRLLLPTCIALVFGGVAAIGQRLGGRAWVGALAVAILAFVGDLSPFRWSQVRSNFDERFLAYFDPVSPSLQFSVAMLLLMSMMVLHLLHEDRPGLGRRGVVLLVGTSILLPLAKGSTPPLAVGGLACVVAMGLLLRRRVRRELVLFGLAAVILVGSQVTLFRGAPGLKVDPFHLIGFVSWNLGLSGVKGGPPVPSDLAVKLFATIGLLLSWAGAAFGVIGFARGGGWRDRRAIFLVGSGVAGIAAAFAFGHPYFAEDYFARTTAAPLAIASAWGLSRLVRDRPPGETAAILGGGFFGGFVLARVASYAAPAHRPVLTTADQHHLILVMLRPYLVIALGLLLVVGALILLIRRGALAKAPALAVVAAVVVGLGLLRVPGTITTVAHEHPVPSPPASTASIGTGGIQAATWLRDHSGTDDLLATNAHYLKPGGKDNRHFWLSAISERRVLVEGWGYTPQIDKVAVDTDANTFDQPFWDLPLLRSNDRAFTAPTTSSLRFLRQHKVRWLFVDTRFPVDLSGLRSLTDQRFHAGSYWVFELH